MPSSSCACETDRQTERKRAIAPKKGKQKAERKTLTRHTDAWRPKSDSAYTKSPHKVCVYVCLHRCTADVQTPYRQLKLDFVSARAYCFAALNPNSHRLLFHAQPQNNKRVATANGCERWLACVGVRHNTLHFFMIGYIVSSVRTTEILVDYLIFCFGAIVIRMWFGGGLHHTV